MAGACSEHDVDPASEIDCTIDQSPHPPFLWEQQEVLAQKPYGERQGKREVDEMSECRCRSDQSR